MKRDKPWIYKPGDPPTGVYLVTYGCVAHSGKGPEADARMDGFANPRNPRNFWHS